MFAPPPGAVVGHHLAVRSSVSSSLGPFSGAARARIQAWSRLYNPPSHLLQRLTCCALGEFKLSIAADRAPRRCLVEDLRFPARRLLLDKDIKRLIRTAIIASPSRFFLHVQDTGGERNWLVNFGLMLYDVQLYARQRPLKRQTHKTQHHANMRKLPNKSVCEVNVAAFRDVHYCDACPPIWHVSRGRPPVRGGLTFGNQRRRALLRFTYSIWRLRFVLGGIAAIEFLTVRCPRTASSSRYPR
jgi:hypothetical protein